MVPTPSEQTYRPLAGTLVVLLSALLFASATVGVKYATIAGEASAIHVTMARFVIGFFLVLPAVIRDRSILKPVTPRWVWLRALGNVTAVFLFFVGIQYTTVSKANLLNMTYPVFVFLFAPAITGEKTRPWMVLMLLVTLLGVWNVVRPEQVTSPTDIAFGDVLAFLSAVVAGFAISVLRRARRAEDSMTIVFYMMAVGLAANAGALFFVAPPAPEVIGIVIAAGTTGALGQVALTVGFRHVSAAAGALLSTARIPVAGVLGIVLFSDPVTSRTILGGALILCSLIGVSLYGMLSTAAARRRIAVGGRIR